MEPKKYPPYYYIHKGRGEIKFIFLHNNYYQNNQFSLWYNFLAITRKKILNKTLKTIEFDKVLEILSRFAKSELGKLKCLNTLPSNNKELIKLNQKLTTQAQNAYRQSDADIPIGNLPDITQPLNLLKNKITLSIEDVQDIASVIVDTRKFNSFLNRYAQAEENLIKFITKLFPQIEIESRLEEIFDSNFSIKETATPELKTLFQSKRSYSENLKNTVSEIMKNTTFSSYLQDNVYTLRDNRIVFQIIAEAKNKVQGIVHDISQ